MQSASAVANKDIHPRIFAVGYLFFGELGIRLDLISLSKTLIQAHQLV